MEIRLIRHATLLVAFQGKRLLIDPMLSRKDAMDPIVNSSNDRRNPLVEISIPQAEYLGLTDGVLLTHTHRDHFDDAAASIIPKDMPMWCQPQDEPKLLALGFQRVTAVPDTVQWGSIRLHRTKGQHGTGEIGQKMAPVSGFVLESSDEPILYIAGDTIYCPEVEEALAQYQPDVTVVNAGGARFISGDPITMTPDDVAGVLVYAPQTRVVAVHMEAINHCLVTRNDLKRYLMGKGLAERVSIPSDGETINIR